MADFERPQDRVRAALPGTLGELALATGYPVGQVLANITRLRKEGVRVNAIEDGVSRSVGRFVDPEVVASTVYSVDTGSEKA